MPLDPIQLKEAIKQASIEARTETDIDQSLDNWAEKVAQAIVACMMGGDVNCVVSGSTATGKVT